MHRSGIEVSQELQNAFQSSGGLLRVIIEDEKFVVKGTETASGSAEKDFEKVKAGLEAKTPQYVCVKVDGKWVLVCYVPENAQVRDKMIYASSRGALKEGLSSSNFSEDFFISSPDECNIKDFNKHIDREVTDDHLTREEIMKKEAHHDSLRSTDSVKMVAIADIPIKVHDDTKALVDKFKAGSIDQLYCQLDKETEALSCRGEEKADLGAIGESLPKKDAAYVLFRYTEDKEYTIFLYYCPDAAHPKSKMFYSSCKSMVIRIFEEMGVTIDKRFEISDAAEELTADALKQELNPKEVTKSRVSKPSKPGRAGKSRFTGSKFSSK